jgi:peroxiredoxin
MRQTGNVSPQAADGSLSTKESKELTFTVLSDPGNQIARQLGILTAPSDGCRAAQLQLGLDHFVGPGLRAVRK